MDKPSVNNDTLDIAAWGCDDDESGSEDDDIPNNTNNSTNNGHHSMNNDPYSNGNSNTMMSGTIDTNTNNAPVYSSVAQRMMVCSFTYSFFHSFIH